MLPPMPVSRARTVLWLVAAAGLSPVAALLAASAMVADADPDAPPQGGFAFLVHVVRSGLWQGRASGEWDGTWRAVPSLQPGDIVLCRNPGSVYGYWSHATIALDERQVLTQDLLRGMGVADAGSLAWYRELRVLRPGTAEQRRRAASAAAATIGGMFNLCAHPRDPRQWTCARVVREAYARAGVAIGAERTWVTPDSLAEAP